MADPPNGLRSCPTRIDGTPVLLAHKVTQHQCTDRQRGRYHKCFTCIHNHAYRASDTLPSSLSQKAPLKPAEKISVG